MENTTLMKSPPELLAVVKESGLADHQKAQAYIGLFVPFMNRLSELEEQIIQVDDKNPTPEGAAKARELRLLYVKNRTASEKTKDATKKSLLVETNLIQSLFNVVLNTSKLKEEHLAKIEKHQELAEAKAKADRLLIRLEELKPFQIEGEAIPEALIGEMNDEMFATYKSGAKAKHDDAQFEIKKLAEAKLLEEKNNELRTQRNNKCLNAGLMWNGTDYVYDETVTIPGASLLSLADKKFEAELTKAKDAIVKIKAKKKTEEETAKSNAEKITKLQDEIREKKETEEKEDQARLKMGDKAKFAELLNDLLDLQTKFQFKSKKYKAMYERANGLLDKVITDAKEQQSK